MNGLDNPVMLTLPMMWEEVDGDTLCTETGDGDGDMKILWTQPLPFVGGGGWW